MAIRSQLFVVTKKKKGRVGIKASTYDMHTSIAAGGRNNDFECDP